MIETETTWKDSGFDCDHCGGVIAERTDRETGQPDSICYQCKQCGCQWTLDGDVQRVGNGPYCKAAQRERSGTNPVEFLMSRRVLIVLGVLALAAILRLGGLAAMAAVARLLIPIGLAALIVVLVVRFGREQEWW